AGRGPVQLVLDDLEELPRFGSGRVVVDRERIKIANLLVEALLGGPDLPDPLHELVEVVGAERGSLLEPLVVEDEALDDVILEPLGGPATELRAPVRADPI